MPSENHLTPREAAHQLGVHVQTLRKWIRKQFLPASNWSCGQGHGNRYRISPEQLTQFERWLHSRNAPLSEIQTNPALPAMRRSISGSLH